MLNGKFDHGMFGPKEPWGVYRPTRPRFRGPKFNEIALMVDKDTLDIHLEVK